MRPLEGLHVLDFCWVAAGPMTTSYLVEYGATVVRIESKRRPEVLRNAPPFGSKGTSPNRSGYHANYNAGKYGFGLNMGHPKAIDFIKTHFVPWADLVTENFTPGTLEKWGLGYDDLRQIKPDIVLFSTSMLGRGGPYSRQPGFGAVLSSLSGMTGVTGWPDRAPTNPYGAYTDFVVPRFSIPTILAALDHRRRTGQGQHLDMSQLEAALHFMAPVMLDYTLNGHEPQRAGNRHPAAAPHSVYPCQGEERWCTIACLTDAHWQALRQAMGQPAWAQDPRYDTLRGRKAHEDAIDAHLSAWTQGWEATALMQHLQQAGVPGGIVNSNRGIFEDAQLLHRGHFVWLEHPEVGRHPVQRSEFHLSQAPPEHHWAAPRIGQHTEQVCREIFGMADADIAALIDEGVLEDSTPLAEGDPA